LNETRLTNWAGNIRYTPARVHRPSSLAELQGLIANNAKVRVLGTGHSFNTIADSAGALVSVDALNVETTLDPAAAALAAIVPSCQARPADHVALSLYHRNLSEQSYSYRVLGTPPGSAVLRAPRKSHAPGRCRRIWPGVLLLAALH
jgi:hypothetical protein